VIPGHHRVRPSDDDPRTDAHGPAAWSTRERASSDDVVAVDPFAEDSHFGGLFVRPLNSTWTDEHPQAATVARAEQPAPDSVGAERFAAVAGAVLSVFVRRFRGMTADRIRRARTLAVSARLGKQLRAS
jgi:hypothetical protein